MHEYYPPDITVPMFVHASQRRSFPQVYSGGQKSLNTETYRISRYVLRQIELCQLV